MVAILGFSHEQIRDAVKEMYTLVAHRPDTPLHFPVGPGACEKALYTLDLLSGIPSSALESFAGVGCPFRADVIRPGQTVLDVGSGSGTDVLIAAKLVGEKGRVIALDLTPAMREKLQALIDKEGHKNIEVIAGDAESIPIPDNTIDVVSSNGVLNLVANKRRAISEIFRVMKQGGYVQIADIVIASPVTPDCEDDPKLWAECVVGATVDENYLTMFRDAGFENVEVLRDYDYFSYSPSRETQEVARQFGAHAFELRMRRSAEAPPQLLQFAMRMDPRRFFNDIKRRGLGGMVGLLLALVACYGTLASIAGLSLLGISLVLDETIWTGAIVGLSLLTAGFIVTGLRKYNSRIPVSLAIAGSLTLSYTMFIDYSLLSEIVGFALLGFGVWTDFVHRRWASVFGGKPKSLRRRRKTHLRTEQSS